VIFVYNNFIFLYIYKYITMDYTPVPKKTFIQTVFNFDDESNSMLLNIAQYTILSIIPVIILNKLMQTYVPDADEDKNSLELSMEVILQILFITLGLVFIQRIATFAPTYSEIPYPEMNLFNYIGPLLVVLLSMQSKLGNKVHILYERVINLINGTNGKSSDNDDEEESNNNNVNAIKSRRNKVRTVDNPTYSPVISNPPPQTSENAINMALDNHTAPTEEPSGLYKPYSGFKKISKISW